VPAAAQRVGRLAYREQSTSLETIRNRRPAVARSDDDTWDITESVGVTALGVAAARAAETRSAEPLVDDPFAQLFVDAVGQGVWTWYGNDDLHRDVPEVAARMETMRGYAASRTRFFDDFFMTAADAGVRQVVILAAGLDSRAWRLPWPGGAVVYEVDQPKVLKFKRDTLNAHGAASKADYVAVPADLRHDWPEALRGAGFDPTAPTAWSAEGLLPYLPAEAQDLLFERVTALSSPASRVAVEAFDRDFFRPDNLERQHRQRQRQIAAAAAAGHTIPDTTELWYIEKRTDVADWLRAHGWTVSSATALELMARHHREPPADADRQPPLTVFVEGRLP
jgi:methyltransferase (TIGR00027 family)